MPRVSVILPVYNGEAFLKEAVDSIFGQTFTDFELIIINDGSSDASAACMDSYSDSRIRYLEQENAGLAATLNKGIALARGEYIARQDQDDISLPERFAAQVAFLDANPGCGIVGTWAEIFSKDETMQRYHRHPIKNLDLKLHLYFRNPFVHSSMMLRTESVRAIGGYTTDKSRQPPEDYELWSRMARQYEVANIGQVLVRYREVGTGMSHDGENPFGRMVHKIACENVAMTLEGQYSQAVASDLVSLLQNFPLPLRLNSSWSTLQRAMATIAERLAVSDPARSDELHANSLEMLQQKHDDFWRSKLPDQLAQNTFFRCVARPLWRAYKRLC